ncbi:MAG: OadG family protein [Treponema sp.]|nr:OadG family protein [Treponema sp.]
MTIIEMLQQTGVLAVLGMSVVFIILWIIIISVNFVKKILFSESIEKKAEKQEIKKPLVIKTPNPEIVAAISVAVSEHRKEI